MSSRGSGQFPIDWQGWRKFRRAGRNCPRCGAAMIVRTTCYECPSCHHEIPKPTTFRERRQSPPDSLAQQIHETVEEAAPAAGEHEPQFVSFDPPRRLNAERQALRILPVIAWLAGSAVADSVLGRNWASGPVGQPSPPAVWLVFISFGLVLLGVAAIYTMIPGFKQAIAVVFLLSAAALLLMPIFNGETFDSYYSVGPGSDHSASWAAIATAVYCVWTASFLDREARLMRQ